MKTPPFTVRTASEKDLDAVCDLVAEAVAALRRNGIDQWDELYPDRAQFAEDIRRNELRLVLCAGRLTALYTVNDRCDPAYANGAWSSPAASFRIIHRLCVAPARQGTGLGSAVIRRIEAELREQGVGAIRLDVFTQNPAAQALYVRAGYRPVGFADWRKGRFLLLEKRLQTA